MKALDGNIVAEQDKDKCRWNVQKGRFAILGTWLYIDYNW